MQYIFFFGLILPLLFIFSFIGIRLKNYKYSPYSNNEDSLFIFAENANELREYIVRIIRYFGKYLTQYLFHIFVRSLYWVKELFDFIYAKARNKFLRSAVKDKRAVSRFWEHLKEYRQEINEEEK